MKSDASLPQRTVAIACGGTGGHLFPGVAVANRLREDGCRVVLLISSKEVDQQAVRDADADQIVSLPAVPWAISALPLFLTRFWRSFHICRAQFRRQQVDAVLAMGSFTSAPPVLAGKERRAATFLHEANAVPGRANRWLAPMVDEAFVAFPEAQRRLRCRSVFTGMPVRPEFKPSDSAACRMALGLDPIRPVLLVTGGSQGARAVNRHVLASVPLLVQRIPELQFLHLTGLQDQDETRTAYGSLGVKAVVRPFLTEMELALGSATLSVSRAGGSSLAELAAMRVPSILLPYPHAADDHQRFNALALAETGAAIVLDERNIQTSNLADWVVRICGDAQFRAKMSRALEQGFIPDAAERVAKRILSALGSVGGGAERPETTLRREESHPTMVETPRSKSPMEVGA